MNWPGLARVVVDAVFAKDEPVVLAATLMTAVLLVLGNLLADILLGHRRPADQGELMGASVGRASQGTMGDALVSPASRTASRCPVGSSSWRCCTSCACFAGLSVALSSTTRRIRTARTSVRCCSVATSTSQFDETSTRGSRARPSRGGAVAGRGSKVVSTFTTRTATSRCALTSTLCVDKGYTRRSGGRPSTPAPPRTARISVPVQFFVSRAEHEVFSFCGLREASTATTHLFGVEPPPERLRGSR